MASISIGRTEDVERIIAHKLNVDPADVMSGSFVVERSPGLVSVEWRCARRVSEEFMREVLDELNRDA